MLDSVREIQIAILEVCETYDRLKCPSAMQNIVLPRAAAITLVTEIDRLKYLLDAKEKNDEVER